MPQVSRSIRAAALALAVAHAAAAQLPLRDTSPHRAGFVAVDGANRIEYLDWGGRGEPLVLVAGMGNTGHVYDDIAPLLRDHFRVIAVTRRGFGASSRSPRGYDTRTLAGDILAVLDTLRLARVVLVGHSLGGAEVTWLAAHHPARVLAVALLESYCYGCPPPTEVPPAPGVRAVGPAMPTAGDRASLAAWARFASRRIGARLPPGEVLATTPVAPDGRVIADTAAARAKTAIRRQLAHSEFGSVRVPIVLVLGLPSRAGDLLPWTSHPDPESMRRARAWLPTERWAKLEWARRFRTLVPAGRVVLVPHGPHHVFLADPTPVVEAIRTVAERAANGRGCGPTDRCN